MRRLAASVTAVVARLGAALLLLAVLVAVPAGAVAVLGRLDGTTPWADALRTGRLDDTTVVRIGVVLFVALWAWFAITAVSEAARVLTSRRHVAPLAPTTSSPTGWVRHLVRVALVSSSAVMGSSLALLSAAAPLRAAALETVPHVPLHDTPSSHDTRVSGPSTLRSNGRETPYSVAMRLGDAGLRDRIIELNRGLRAPDGSTWTSGVFPEGMDVVVPAGLLQRDEVTWQPYSVVEGDSVYRIATRLAAGDHRRVRPLADQIIERNVGRLMNDGRVFDDPSLLRIGWVIEVPVPVAAAPPTGAVHTVVAGDSYWRIAEQTLGDGAPPAQVAELTATLVAVNAPVLGHDDPTLIVPGDTVTVDLGAPDAVPAVDEPVATDDLHDAMVVVVEVPAEATPIEPAVPAVPTSDPAATPPPTVAPSVPLAAAPAPAVDPAPDASPDPAAGSLAATDDASSVGSRLGAAVLLCAGALGLVETRRRHQLRRATAASAITTPDEPQVRTERALRSLDAVRRAARLDLALRSAGHQLAPMGGWVLGAITTADGAVTLLVDRAGRSADAPWRADGDRWILGADVPDSTLAEAARLCGQPCPAVVHLGALVRDHGGAGHVDPTLDPQVFVDLEAVGLTAVDGAALADGDLDATRLVTALAASVAVSPVGENVHVVATGIDPGRHLAAIDHARVDHTDDVDDALDLAAAALGTTPTVIGGRRTFELRARGVGGEAWEPVVVVIGGEQLRRDVADEMSTMARGGGRGLALVVDRAVDGAGLTLRAAPDGWHVDPLDLVVTPVCLTDRDVASVAELVAASERPLAEVPLRTRVTLHHAPLGPVEPAWSLMVHVLGRLHVTDPHGTEVAFERGKALELVAWLALHRERATRGAARATLWETAVRDATFANVVSEARRALARAVPPPDGHEWIGRTLTDHLPLHPCVVTDADVLRCRLEHARSLPPAEAIDVLAPGVALLHGMPFTGSDLLWPDSEGITSSLVLLATAAAAELAGHHLALGDIDGVFRATAAGLDVLPGHEELIGLRMRAHARRGDHAGVRHEWETYERALLADTWSGCDPSPKLVALRRQLLTS